MDGCRKFLITWSEQGLVLLDEVEDRIFYHPLDEVELREGRLNLFGSLWDSVRELFGSTERVE